MAGPESNTLNIAVDFRLPLNPPQFDPDQQLTGKDVQQIFNELWTFALAVQQAFNINSGVGARPTSQQSLLAGSSDTVQSGNLNRMYVTGFGAPLAEGYPVTIFDNAGVTSAVFSDAVDNTRPVQAFVSQPGGIAVGQIGEVIVSDGIADAVGLVKGNRYYLAVGGGLTAVAPVAAGNIEQYLGIALDTTHLLFNCHYWIQH